MLYIAITKLPLLHNDTIVVPGLPVYSFRSKKILPAGEVTAALVVFLLAHVQYVRTSPVHVLLFNLTGSCRVLMDNWYIICIHAMVNLYLFISVSVIQKQCVVLAWQIIFIILYIPSRHNMRAGAATYQIFYSDEKKHWASEGKGEEWGKGGRTLQCKTTQLIRNFAN